jgi:hypothetical protein
VVTDDTIGVGIGTSFVYPDVVTLGAFVNFEGRGVVAFDDHLGWFWFGALYYRDTLDDPNFNHLKLTFTPITFAVGFRACAV